MTKPKPKPKKPRRTPLEVARDTLIKADADFKAARDKLQQAMERYKELGGLSPDA